MTQRKRLTRAEIKEGLKQTSIQTVLLGATSANGVKLTKKQKTFAKKIVETGNRQKHTDKPTTRRQASRAKRNKRAD